MDDRIRFHLDEHIWPSVATALRRHGIDVTTTNEMGMRGESDAEHLAFAIREGRVIVTKTPTFSGTPRRSSTIPGSFRVGGRD